MAFVFVCIGGFFGAIVRFFIFQIVTQKGRATLIVNTIGSFLIGMCGPLLHDGQQQLIVLGFLGAFTTFSTFALDVVQLGKNNKKEAVRYVIRTLLYGGIAVYIGYTVALLVT